METKNNSYVRSRIATSDLDNRMNYVNIGTVNIRIFDFPKFERKANSPTMPIQAEKMCILLFGLILLAILIIEFITG